MQRTLLGFVLVASALQAACKGTEAPAPTATGRWLGSLPPQWVYTTIDLSLQETNGIITGTGVVGSFSVLVTGKDANSTVSLTMNYSGAFLCSFSGQFSSATVLSGQLNGFGNPPMTLVRQK